MKNTVTLIYPADRTFTFARPKGEAKDVVEQVFAMFNAGSSQECFQFLDSQARSMSVNDFIRVDDTWYQCCSAGWRVVTREYINNVVELVESQLNPLTSSPWSVLNEIVGYGFVNGDAFHGK